MNLLLNQFYKHILKRDFIELYEKQRIMKAYRSL